MGGTLQLKVAIDATALGSMRGGDETLLRGLLTGLAEVSDAGDTTFPLLLRTGVEPPGEVSTHPAFPRYHLPERSRAVRYAYDLPRVLARQVGPVDVLYTQTHAPLVGPAPNVLQLTDLSFHHHPELYPPLTRLRLNALVPLHAQRARAVLAISEFTRQDVIRTYGVPPERVFLVPCSITRPTDPVPASAGDVERWLEGYGVRRPYFLFVGNLHPRKNLRRLVEAFERGRRQSEALSRHQLVLVGTEHRFYPRVWGSDVARSLSDAGIVAVGRVSDAERDRFMRHADALAYPSLFEGFGLPPVEAMAVGTPVLAANTAALPEILGDAALLVDPLDVDAIARGLVRLATDANLARTLSQRGRRRAAFYATRRSGDRALEAFAWAASSARQRASLRDSAVSVSSHSRSMPGSSAITSSRRQAAPSQLRMVSTVTRLLAPFFRTLRATSRTSILDHHRADQT